MTGGYSISSTEQLVKDGTEWILTENSLPARMYGLRGISFDNQIFTTGKANILNKILFIYITNHSFYFQEDMIGMLLFTQIRYWFGKKRQQPSKRLANWNKEDVIIQWVLLTSMILLVPNFEHVHDSFKTCVLFEMLLIQEYCLIIKPQKFQVWFSKKLLFCLC